jgi:hypothetical protein
MFKIYAIIAFCALSVVVNRAPAQNQTNGIVVVEDPTALIIKVPAKQRQISRINTVDADQNTPYAIIEDPTAIIVKTPAKKRQGSVIVNTHSNDSSITKKTINRRLIGVNVNGGEQRTGTDPSVDCTCDAIYEVLDIVMATVDSPSGAIGVMAGDTGYVVCGQSTYPDNPLMVAWDGWDGGHDNVEFCECGDGGCGCVGNSGWYVTCEEVELHRPLVDCACDAIYEVGDIIMATVDSPSGAIGVMAGDTGVMVCGQATYPDNPLMVAWDGWDGGHDNVEFCECGNGGSTDGINGWYVTCEEIELNGAGCPGDLNGDDTVDIGDLLALIGTWGPCANCVADVNNDGSVDVADILQLIVFWGECPEDAPLGACVIPNQSCTIVNEADCTSSGGMGWLESGSCDDTDGDRIPDDFELGDCSVPSGAYSGSYSNDSDTDNDGINDGDEAYGTLAGLDLPLFGCNPCKYDILVESDWVYGTGIPADSYKLHANQAANVVASFANSPVINEDSTLGINLHLDYGQYPYNGGNSVVDPNGNNIVDMDDWDLDGSEYQSIKDANFAANRNGFFHYSLSVWKFSTAGVAYGYSGVAEINGDDFILATGQYFSDDDDRIGNTFMHELGHNLNLRHGGFENLNYKPNYNSVMNYRFQMCGVDDDGDTFPDLVLDYSRGSYIDLNESDLDETIGVTGVGPAIDWDLDGNSNETGITRNVNCKIWDAWNCGPYSLTTKSCGSGNDCGDSSCNVISDYNDWLNIVYSGISEGDFAPKEIIFCSP